ncbi:MAG: response regulator [bacterium]
MHLLVVDDDSVTRMTFRTVLTSDGHTVTVANDGEDALAKILHMDIDMVITDVRMPRLNGIRLRNAVRLLPDKAHLPFLFISGYDDDGTIAAANDTAKEGFYKKGNQLVELLGWIKYLTTPVGKRSPYPPDAHKSSAKHHHRYRQQSRQDNRPHA